MRRLRYGPRFSGSQTIDARYEYDPAMDIPKPFRSFEKGSAKTFLIAGKGQGAMAASKARVGMPHFSWDEAPSVSAKQAREQAELVMLQRLEAIAQSLEFGLTELQETPEPAGNYRRLVYQKQIVDLLHTIKTKCLKNLPPPKDEAEE